MNPNVRLSRGHIVNRHTFVSLAAVLLWLLAPSGRAYAQTQVHGSRQHDGMPGMTGMSMPAPTSPAPSTPETSMPGMNMSTPGSASPSLETEAPELPGPPLAREALEKGALSHNPTLAQAEAMIDTAEGLRQQAGLYPNPSLGYNSESATPALRGGEQGFIIQQTIVTAGKLRLAQDVAAKQKSQMLAETETQRYRVLNAVDTSYYDALAAQRIVETSAKLWRLANQAVDITYRLKNVGQADAPDLLQAQVEAHLAHIALTRAVNDQRMVWRELSAVVGDPDLLPHQLAGNLDDLPKLDPDAALDAILESSPEVRAAELGVERAKAALARARVEPIPNINFIGGMRVNFERPEPRASIIGPAALAEITATVPIFDRNQGNISAARAETIHAQNEVTRTKLELRQRFAPVFASYLTAMEAADDYKTAVLPETHQAYQLYLQRFEQMAAAYPQVLIAQRTMAQAEEEYVTNLRTAWEQVVQLKGMLLSGGLTAPQMPTSGELPTAAAPSAATILRTSPGG